MHIHRYTAYLLLSGNTVSAHSDLVDSPGSKAVELAKMYVALHTGSRLSFLFHGSLCQLNMVRFFDAVD